MASERSELAEAVDNGSPVGDDKHGLGLVESTRGAEAARAEAAAAQDIDMATEKRVVRKFDRHVVSLFFVLYLFAFLDRSNIGNAYVAGMQQDLHLTSASFQWLLTIFYIPYILFEWCALMWMIVPPHIWACAMVFIWGLASTLQAAATNWEGMMACRFFLGMAEAGFGPGVPFMLSFFYRRNELGFRSGLFLSAAPLATSFSGALAYGITSAKNTAIAPWRMLFLIEGLPNMALAVAVFYFLPDTPDTARFMTADEVAVAKARSILQSGKEGKARLGSVQGKEIWEALRLPQTWIFPFMYFSCNVSFASLPAFLPTIIKEMGYSSIEAQGLTAPPYLLAFFVCLASTWLADRWQQRGLIITALSLVGGLGFVLLAAAKGVGARYTGVFLACAGAFPAIANILSWVVNNQGTDTKRGVAIAMLNTIGQCGPLLGTNMFPAAEKPYYVKGMAVCAAFMFLNAVLAVTLRTLFVAKIRRLERREQESVAATTAGAHVAQAKRMVEMEGTFGYRYIL